MNVEIRPMTELEYLIGFAGQRTAYADRCAEEAAAAGVLLGAKDGGAYAGYLLAAREGRVLRVLYGCTVPACREKGVFTALLRRLTALLSEKRNADRPWLREIDSVRVGIQSRHPYHEAVARACRRLGFSQEESVAVYTCRRKEDVAWDAFMKQKGEKMCALLLRWGYEAVSFRDAEESVIEQLRFPERSGYGATFDVAGFLDNPAKKTDWDMSFAAVNGGRLAAYTLVTRDSESAVVFQIISDSVSDRGKGVVLLPFVESMKRFQAGGYKTLSYAMYGSNSQANAFRREALSGFQTEESTSENYYFPLSRRSALGKEPEA